MGDTGPQNDPRGHGLDLSTVLGKISRIDVDRAEKGRSYAIPSNNPFRKSPNARPEVWALGLREPWWLRIDAPTGDLWVGDVGQGLYEEVTIARQGENHGWNGFEGFRSFTDRYAKEGARYVPPVFAYHHRVGFSVTGGFVYRGKNPRRWLRPGSHPPHRRDGRRPGRCGTGPRSRADGPERSRLMETD